MGHASDIITVDVYGDNDEIITDSIDELETFIETVRSENRNYNIMQRAN